MTEPKDLRKKLELALVVLLILFSLLYGAFKIYPLIIGPSVTIYNPHDGDIVPANTFEVSGQALRVKEVTIQGRPIPIGTDGHFAELLLSQAPYTLVVVTATDFYGKTITKTFRVSPEKD
jgi:hypothetical protein